MLWALSRTTRTCCRPILKVTKRLRSWAIPTRASRCIRAEGANVELIVDGKPMDRAEGPMAPRAHPSGRAPRAGIRRPLRGAGLRFVAGEPCGLNGCARTAAQAPRSRHAFLPRRSSLGGLLRLGLRRASWQCPKRRNGPHPRDHLVHDVFVRAFGAGGRPDDSADRPRVLAAAGDRGHAGGSVHLLRHGSAGAGAGRGFRRQETRDDRLPGGADDRVVSLRRRNDLPAIVHFRVIAGAGCGGLFPLGMALLSDLVPLAQRQCRNRTAAGRTPSTGNLLGSAAAGIVADYPLAAAYSLCSA